MGRKKKIKAPSSDKPIPFTPVDQNIGELVAPTGTEGAHDVTFSARVLPESGLKDSGLRTQSITGALREPDPTNNVRPRYDLIPPLERAAVIHANVMDFEYLEDAITDLLANDYRNMWSGEGVDGDPYGALAIVGATLVRAMAPSLQAWKRLAIHYARGAVKYADRNWEKGLETSRTIASLMRHLQQAKEGLTDEDHLAASLWNVVALMNTVRRLKSGALPVALDTYGLLKNENV